MAKLADERLDRQAPEAGVRSVIRSLSIMLALTDSGPEGVGLEELGRRTGLAKSTAHRLLETLVNADFVEAAERHGSYRLGLNSVVVGSAAVRIKRPKDAIQPIIRRVRDATRETVGLGAMVGLDVVSVARELSSQPLHWNISVGSTMPAACSAAGKVLLAALDDDRVEQLYRSTTLPQPTRRNAATVEELVERVAEVREQGFALDDEELMEGLRCIAVPVQNGASETVYAFGISGPASRLTPAELIKNVPLLLEAAREIQAILAVDQLD